MYCCHLYFACESSIIDSLHARLTQLTLEKREETYYMYKCTSIEIEGRNNSNVRLKDREIPMQEIYHRTINHCLTIQLTGDTSHPIRNRFIYLNCICSVLKT